ncbi:MAG: hypothetical protein AAGE76_03055 [Pseudomonadota bacterium]
MDGPALLDSITDIAAGHAGAVIVSGSHGGLYPATMASRGGARAAILVDAGVGLDRAGVAGVEALDATGMAAAAAATMSCRIGDASDVLARGVLSVANAAARALGLHAGQPVAEAVRRLSAAPLPREHLPEVSEARREVSLPFGGAVVLVDSASLVGPEDAGRLVVTGSHGGLIGGDPARALKAAAAAAAFHDAGRGPQNVALQRLPALDAKGIPAVCVASDSARIGDAGSCYATGVLSAANAAATSVGARPGALLKEWLATLAEAR